MSRTTTNRLLREPPNPRRHETRKLDPPNRVRRAEELALINLIAALLGVEWFVGAAKLDDRTTIELITDVGAPATPMRMREALATTIGEVLAEPESRRETTILSAATRWFVLLDLPGNGDELWAGPPLKLRRRDRPVVVELRAGELRAALGFASECLDGDLAHMSKGDAIDPDELRQVLHDFSNAGGGRVEIGIVRVADARRVFSRMGSLASRSGWTDWRVVAEACRRIVRAIDADRSLFVGMAGS
jgi:hypothetical protein